MLVFRYSCPAGDGPAGCGGQDLVALCSAVEVDQADGRGEKMASPRSLISGAGSVHHPSKVSPHRHSVMPPVSLVSVRSPPHPVSSLSTCQIVQHCCVLNRVQPCFRTPYFRDPPTPTAQTCPLLLGRVTMRCCGCASLLQKTVTRPCSGSEFTVHHNAASMRVCTPLRHLCS